MRLNHQATRPGGHCRAVAAGASGLMIETHYNPSEAPVDGMQMITPDELKEVINACRKIHKLIVQKHRVKVLTG